MKKYSNYLLSVMFSMGISVGALKASSCVLEQNSTQDLPTPTLITPEIEVSIIPAQPSGTSQLTSGPIMLPTTSQIISRDTDQTVTVTGEPPISTDQETNIPTSQTVLQPTGIPVLPQMCIDPATSTSNNETAPVVINPIVTLAQPTALPQNTNNPTEKRRSSPWNKNVGVYALKHLPTIEDMPWEDVQNAHETARKVGRTNGRTRDIAETGWLFAVVTWYMQYIGFNKDLIETSKGSTQNMSDQPHRLRYKIAGLKDRLQRAQQSLNPDALQNLSDEEKANFLNYLSKVAPKCEGRLRMLIENGYGRLMKNDNASALRIVLPDPLPDLATLRRLPQIADDEMHQDQVHEAIGILSSIGKMARGNIQTSGWLPLVMRATAGDTLYLNRLLEIQQSFNQDTLTNITDAFGRAAVMEYLPLLAKKSTPLIKEVIENALGRFRGNPNALAIIPSVLKRTGVRTAQLTIPPSLPPVMPQIKFLNPIQTTYVSNDEVNDNKAPETINPSALENHSTSNITPDHRHTDITTQNPVDREALKQKVESLSAEVASLKALLSQFMKNSNPGNSSTF